MDEEAHTEPRPTPFESFTAALQLPPQALVETNIGTLILRALKDVHTNQLRQYMSRRKTAYARGGSSLLDFSGFRKRSL